MYGRICAKGRQNPFQARHHFKTDNKLFAIVLKSLNILWFIIFSILIWICFASQRWKHDRKLTFFHLFLNFLNLFSFFVVFSSPTPFQDRCQGRQLTPLTPLPVHLCSWYAVALKPIVRRTWKGHWLYLNIGSWGMRNRDLFDLWSRSSRSLKRCNIQNGNLSHSFRERKKSMRVFR